MRVSYLTFFVLLAACGEEELERRPVPDGATIIVVGDSVFEYYIDEEGSIPDVIGEELGRVVYHAAISGTLVTAGEMSIPEQYVDGDWEWLVAIGGANDVNDLCECGDCGEVIDEIIGPDGATGLFVDLVHEAVGQGARVVVVAYYNVPPTADYGFDRCNDEVDELRARQQLLADGHPDVFLVDAGELFSPDQLEHYHDDHAHPSPLGSRVIGEAVAARIASVEDQALDGGV